MKKVFLAILILLFFVTMASADISDLSFSELQDELDSYNLKLWEAGNWSSIIVPNGTYEVGKDLPEGSYVIKSCTSKMDCWFKLFPSGSNNENYYEDPRYLDIYLDDSEKNRIDLINGDVFTVAYAGALFVLEDYIPRFNPDPQQEEAVQNLQDEYNALKAELRARPEWCEIEVPEGLYEVGPKIPAGRWTIWPKDSRAGVHYGSGLNSKGEIAYSEINAALKDSSLKSFVFGYHEGWVSIDMQEGYYVEIEGSVIFTPYIGTTPFQFNK